MGLPWPALVPQQLLPILLPICCLSCANGSRLRTVRPRVQIPGPRQFLHSKSAISESLWSQRHTAGSQFPTEQPNRGGANRVVVGYVRSLVATAGHAASPSGGLTSQDREAPDAEFQARIGISR
jgi:hypothetical protein